MITRIALYGGTDLSAELASFVTSLTKSLLAYPEVVLVSGGFHYYVNHPERKSVDSIVMETAKKVVAPEQFKERFETWIPKENDRENVQRFREGKVVEIAGSTQARRFNLVRYVDLIVTIKGRGNTRSIIELALAINKPVLPVAFTGGDSKKMWALYKADIIKILKLPEELDKRLQKIPVSPDDIDEAGKDIAHFAKEAGKKMCLVLMPFGKAHDNFYDNFLKGAITGSGFAEHRIDRNDPAGNIPDLFRTSLERAKAVIVDVTGYNANVMYELGHVHAKNISPLIILRNGNTQEVPFYLKQEMIVAQPDNEEGYAAIQSAIAKFLDLYR